MKLLRFLVALVFATAFYGGALKLFPALVVWVDPFLILVLFLSLECHPAWSLSQGMVAGLAYDAMSGGLFGLHGIANTIVGYASARLQQRFVVQGAFQVSLLFALATALQQALLAFLQFLLVRSAEISGAATVGGKMLITSVVCTVLFKAASRFQHWRSDRSEHRKRRLTMTR